MFVEMYLSRISQGAMGTADLRRLLTQNRQAIADWTKLATPYALAQARWLDAEIPTLEKLLSAAVEHEKKHPVATFQIH